MVVISIVISLAGLAALCWLLFNLAVFALPMFIAFTAGSLAYGSGAGIPGAAIVGGAAAALFFGLNQTLFLVLRPAWIKLLTIIVFVAPAAVAGYYATLGIGKLTMPSETWQMAFAALGAISVGVAAFIRLTRMARPAPIRRALQDPRD